MKKKELDEYNPIIDTTKVSDEDLKIWFGSNDAIKFLRSIEGCELYYNKFKPNIISFLKYDRNRKKCKKEIMIYDLKTNDIFVEIKFNFTSWSNYQEYRKIVQECLNLIFKYKPKLL